MKKKLLSEYFIYLALFLIPFYFFRFSVLGIKTNVFEIGVLVALAAELISIKKITGSKIKSGMTKWLLPLIFLAIAFISIFFSSDKAKALGIFKGWFLVPVVFAWLIEKKFNKKNISNIAIPLYISLMIISIWSILQKMGFITTLFYQAGDVSFGQYLHEGRVFGPFESPNFLAMFLVPVAFISLFLREKIKPRLYKLLFLASFVLPLFALYFSGSRGGYAAAFVGFVIFLNYRYINILRSRERKPFFKYAFILFFVLINIFYLALATRISEAQKNREETRSEIYRYSTTLVRDNPLMGIGLGDFNEKISIVSKNNNSFQEFVLPYALHPHNLFLALWLNLGILGLIIFILIITKFFSSSFMSDSTMRGYIVAAMAAIIIHGLFDTTYFKNDLSAIFWLLFAIALINRKEVVQLADE